MAADATRIGATIAEMPSWVKAPGNHPLVAAFPVPKIEVAESSLHVETVTTVTTDHVIGNGEEKSYSTAKTQGTSTSIADTVTRNQWQEVSVATPGQVSSADVYLITSDGTWWKFGGQSASVLGGIAAGAVCAASLGIGCGVLAGIAVLGVAGASLDGEQLDINQSNQEANDYPISAEMRK